VFRYFGILVFGGVFLDFDVFSGILWVLVYFRVFGCLWLGVWILVLCNNCNSFLVCVRLVGSCVFLDGFRCFSCDLFWFLGLCGAWLICCGFVGILVICGCGFMMTSVVWG